MTRAETRLEEARRLNALDAYIAAEPLTPVEIRNWVRGLGDGTNSVEGRACALDELRDMRRHAYTDDMLDYDKTLIIAEIARLEQELAHEPSYNAHRRRPRRNHYVLGEDTAAPSTSDDDDAWDAAGCEDWRERDQ